MKIDLQTVLIAAALLGAGALVLMPRRQAAAAAPAPQMSGAGAVFANMYTGAYSSMNVADYLPSAGLAALNVHGAYAVPSMYVDGMGQWTR